MMSTLMTFQVLILPALVYFILRFWKHRVRFRGLPQPPHSILWGHLGVLRDISNSLPPNTHPQILLTIVARKYNLKGLFYLDLWPLTAAQVVICDADLQHQIILSPCLPKHPIEEKHVAPIIGPKSMGTNNGSLWRDPYRAITPAMTMSRVRSLTGLLVEEAVRFGERLGTFASTGETFSLSGTVEMLTFEITARMILGLRLDAQTKPNSYLGYIKDMVRLGEDRLTGHFVAKFINDMKRKSVSQKLNKLLEDQIDTKFEEVKNAKIASNCEEPDSILVTMLRHDFEQSQKTSMRVHENGRLVGEYRDRMVTNMKGLLAAGSGASKTTISYSYMLCSRNKTALDLLREEHDRLFPYDLEETIRMMKERPAILNELRYTDGVIKEALRLFPIGVGVREAKNDATLEYNGRPYPIGGLPIAAPGHIVHYDPDCYPSPTEFRPERWIGEEKARSEHCFRGFGRGQRVCTGMNIAMHELRTILLLTIRYFDFSMQHKLEGGSPRACFTDLDTVFGDTVFQEMGLEAKPRGPMLTQVERRYQR